MDKKWINDNEFECNTCNQIFKVYCLNDEPLTSFCPLCGSRDIDIIEED